MMKSSLNLLERVTRKSGNKTELYLALAFLFAVTLWEICSNLSSSLAFILPSPSQILFSLKENFSLYLYHTQITVSEMVIGSTAAFLISLPLAWSMAEFSFIKRTLQPLFIIFQCIPIFTLAPIMIIWFDWSSLSILVPTTLMIFFPITLTLFAGLTSTPKELIELFKLHNATRWQLFFKLTLPWSLPHLFSGLKMAAAIAGIGAITAEWAGAQVGLGVLIQESRLDMDIEATFSAIACLVVVSSCLYLLIACIEKMICKQRYV